MRVLLGSVLLAIALAGCARKHATIPPSAAFSPLPAGNKSASQRQVIVTPETGLSGKVARVNLSGRFVVLNFPLGHLPVPGQQLFLYRQGLKCGEVKITGPQVEDSVVADLVNGDAQPGDLVRDR